LGKGRKCKKKSLSAKEAAKNRGLLLVDLRTVKPGMTLHIRFGKGVLFWLEE
jgi:hypothetical protein